MEKPGSYRETMESPCRNAYAVTPHDSNEIGPYLPRALYVGSGGTLVALLDGDSSSVTFANVPNGSVLPIRPRVILSTGTTASSILALY